MILRGGFILEKTILVDTYRFQEDYHKLLNHYGLVLIDECHHCASETIANVLKEVKARYVYGVTATPKRGDGLEKSIIC